MQQSQGPGSTWVGLAEGTGASQASGRSARLDLFFATDRLTVSVTVRWHHQKVVMTSGGELEEVAHWSMLQRITACLKPLPASVLPVHHELSHFVTSSIATRVLCLTAHRPKAAEPRTRGPGSREHNKNRSLFLRCFMSQWLKKKINTYSVISHFKVFTYWIY